MKRVVIDFIPQSEQRYNTVGDYGETETEVWFKITLLSKPIYSVCVLMHEIWEFFRNKDLGIPVEAVDEFDLENFDLDDPGLSPDAPYHKTHMEADAIERACIVMAGEDWVEYSNDIEGGE